MLSIARHLLASAASVALLLLPTATAITPSGSEPTVNATFGVAYNKTVINGHQLFRTDMVQNQPNISYATTAISNSTYMLVMMDITPASAMPVFQRRLHWWAVNLTSVDMSLAHSSPNTSNLTTSFHSFLTNSTPALADYQGPGGQDIMRPHDYVFYLFTQPMGFSATTLYPGAAQGNFSMYVDGRINFDIDPVIETAGVPIAATFMQAWPIATGLTYV